MGKLTNIPKYFFIVSLDQMTEVVSLRPHTALKGLVKIEYPVSCRKGGVWVAERAVVSAFTESVYGCGITDYNGSCSRSWLWACDQQISFEMQQFV